jgi:hypothetical protein
MTGQQPYRGEIMTEEEIASLFDRVAQDLDVPGIDALVSGAERNGRRLRNRHRAFLAAGSVLVAGAVVVAGTTTGVVPRLTGALGATSPAAGASPAPGPTADTAAPAPTPSPRPTATTAPTPTTGPAASNGPPMTTTQIMDDLQAMLPAGSGISDIRSDLPEWVDFDYNDGKGAVDFMFSIALASSYKNPLTCSEPPWSGSPDNSPRPAGALPQSCVMRTPADGSLERDWVTYADMGGFYSYSVTDQRPDGTVVWAQVSNGINHTTPAVDRAVPPGSFAEWNALVESPVWHL